MLFTIYIDKTLNKQYGNSNLKIKLILFKIYIIIFSTINDKLSTTKNPFI